MTNREINHENQSIRALITKKQLLNDLLITVVVGILLGFLSPFGMHEVPVTFAISYWVMMCTCGYFIYMPCTQLSERYLTKIVPKNWVRFGISIIVASILMSFFVPFSVWLFFNIPINYSQQFWQVFPKVILIGGILSFIGFVKDYIKRQNSKLNESEQQLQKHAVQENLKFEKFMAQLPVEKRGKLYCLEMSDHYLKVYTDKGHHLLLMRFKDALDLLSDYQGMQTHRSWWVALDAIVKVNKEGRKISLEMINQLQVPVSRTYAEAIKTADIH